MAKRFAYIPVPYKPYVRAMEVEFKWESGMSLSQKKKSRDNFHKVLTNFNPKAKILECSRASDSPLGLNLSAFNLPFYDGSGIRLENVYQGSKVMKNLKTGEEVWLNKLYSVPPMEAKIEPLLTNKEYRISEFRLFDEDNKFDGNLSYAFYNYIYIKSLMAYVDRAMVEELASYSAFTDTMLRWYDGKITSCQAHAVAQFVGMLKSGVLTEYINDKDKFISLFLDINKPKQTQLTL